MPHPCRCRICKRMGWETHALLAELARHLDKTQGEVLRDAVHATASVCGLLPEHPRPRGADPFRSALRIWLAGRIREHPSPRQNGSRHGSPVRRSNNAPDRPEPLEPPLHPFREHKRGESAKLSKWEKYWIRAAD